MSEPVGFFTYGFCFGHSNDIQQKKNELIAGMASNYNQFLAEGMLP
jgi:hypothetical protein